MTDCSVSFPSDTANEKIYASLSGYFEVNSPYYFISPQVESTHA
jgi:hypothetical protein